MEDQAAADMRTSVKGIQDAQMWNYFKDTPEDDIGGPKQSYKVHSRRRDLQHKEIIQSVLNRQMLTLKTYDVIKRNN